MSENEENAYELWGWSKELRRNFVLGTVSLLVLAIIALFGVLKVSEAHHEETRKALIECERENSRNIERLQESKIEMMGKVNELYKDWYRAKKKLK